MEAMLLINFKDVLPRDLPRLLKCLYDTLQLEFGGFKTYVNKQNTKIKGENSKRFSFTKKVN